VAGRLGERKKLGSGRRSISITWWLVAFRSHWMVWPAVVDGGGSRLWCGGWEGWEKLRERDGREIWDFGGNSESEIDT
jgi:hypothetical protein